MFGPLRVDIDFLLSYFQVCTNGLVSCGSPYEAWSVPDFRTELADTFFSSRYMLCPFFMDVVSVSDRGIISYRKVDTLADDFNENDQDVVAVDQEVKKIQNLSVYKSVQLFKVTWENVNQFGGRPTEVYLCELISVLLECSCNFEFIGQKGANKM